MVKSQTILGEALCDKLRSLYPIRPIVRHHHERLDGSGYRRAARRRNPSARQIIGVVDVFDAVTTQRPYRVRDDEHALDILREQVHLGWRRRDLVETFAGIVHRGTLEVFRG